MAIFFSLLQVSFEYHSICICEQSTYCESVSVYNLYFMLIYETRYINNDQIAKYYYHAESKCMF